MRTAGELKRMEERYDSVFGDIALDESGPLDKNGIRTIARDRDFDVVVSGAVGSGKSFEAEFLHYSGKGSPDNFILCDAAVLTSNLHESRLFGYCKGAFTGATEDKIGYVQAAEGGTLFIDDIRAASIDAQCTLLTFCQDKTYHRVGDSGQRKANVRLIYACHTNMKELVRQEKFKDDLLDRMLHNSYIIYIRPLREVKHLLPGITKYFLEEMGNRIKFTDDAYEFICEYDWPRQMRQLKGTIAMLSRKYSGSVSRGVLEKLVLTIAKTTSYSSTTTSSDQVLAYFQSWGGKFNDFGKEASRIVFQDSYERHNHVGKEVARELGISPQKVVNCKEMYKMPIRHSRKLF